MHIKFAFAAALALAVGSVESFQTAVLPTITRSSSTVSFAYVPDGFTPESYKKFKEQEKKKQATNLGGLGPRGFKSRSMQSFQEALERGEAAHLMPMFNAKEKLKSGKIRKEDIPVSESGEVGGTKLDYIFFLRETNSFWFCSFIQYMQRGGSWDNTDVKGAKNKKRWLSSDKQYAAGGYKKEQSVSVLGFGEGLDWSGTRAKKGPEQILAAAPKFAKNYKAPNVYNMKGVKKPVNNNNSGDEPPKKKFFGMF